MGSDATRPAPGVRCWRHDNLSLACGTAAMNPVIITTENASDAVGLVVAEETRLNGKRAFRKGHRITAGDLDTLAALDGPVHAVQFEPGDVHEDDAAITLANFCLLYTSDAADDLLCVDL